ncbi:MAG: hypothetical protein ACKV1O_29000, partial [Saprospiraceae bacterium]
LDEAAQDFLSEKMDIKVVFAIREDRLHLLDKLRFPLPSIFARRFPLLPLPRAQAEEALARPAALAGDFASPPFALEGAAMGKILDFLSDPEGRVEANQLQILAESFEKRAQTEGITLFSAEKIGSLKAVVSDYYREKITSLPDKTERLAARRLCEEGLSQEGDPPVRLNLHEAQIRNFYGIQPALLEKLVALRLLRSEPGAGGGYTYELPHDTLLEPVIDAKRERLEEEKKEEARIEREKTAARTRELEAQAEAEKRRRQRATSLAIAAVVGLVIALGAMFWAFSAQQKAEKALSELKIENEKRLAAEAAKRVNEFDKELSVAYGQLSGGNSCLGDETFGHLQTAVFELNSEETKKKIQDLNQAIQKNNADCPIFKIQK